MDDITNPREAFQEALFRKTGKMRIWPTIFVIYEYGTSKPPLGFYESQKRAEWELREIKKGIRDPEVKHYIAEYRQRARLKQLVYPPLEP